MVVYERLNSTPGLGTADAVSIRYKRRLCVLTALVFGCSQVLAQGMPPARAASPIPIVSKVRGVVSVSREGVGSHSLQSAQRARPGETYTTGEEALADVLETGVARVRLGPKSALQLEGIDDRFAVRLLSGMAGLEATAAGPQVFAGPLTLTARGPARFEVARTPGGGVQVAILRGSVNASDQTGTVTQAEAGSALYVTVSGRIAPASSAVVEAQFVPLRFTDTAAVAPSSAPSPAPAVSPPAQPAGNNGGAGTAILLGVLGAGGVAALALGKGGAGGSSASSPTAPPTVTPTLAPSPVPTATPSASPTPALHETPTPTPTPTISPAPGPLALSVSTLSFTPALTTATFTAGETHYAGTFSAVSADPAVASISPASGSANPQTFTVTASTPGNTTITIRDDHGGVGLVSILVTGSLTVSQNSLIFSGSSTPQTFNATEPGYKGALTVAAGTPGIVSVSPASGTGPTQTFTVIPIAAGTTTLTVSDTQGQSAPPIAVTVTASGILIGGNLPLALKGIGSRTTFTAQENNYSGLLTASSSPGGIVNLMPASQNGPGPVTFTVTSIAAGNATITVSDAGQPQHTASLLVGVTGPLKASPASLNFAGTTQSQSFVISEANYAGPFTVTTSDPSGTIATVTPLTESGPSALFSVTPVAKGSVTFTISDTQGQSTTVTATVSAGMLTVSNGALKLYSGGAPGSVTVSETNYAGGFTPTVTGSSASVSVSPASANGPLPQTFTITPTSVAGVATVTFSDDHGGSAAVSVTVIGAIAIDKASLTLDAAGSAGSAPGNVTVTEPDYAGQFTTSISGSAASISIAPGAGNGPSQSFTIMPTSTPGTATVTFTDDHGGSVSTVVTVLGPITISAPSLSLSAGGPAGNILVSEANYTGPFTTVVGGSASSISIATTGSGPSQSFVISPTSTPGIATVTFSDNHGGSAAVTVTVAGVISSDKTALTLAPSASGNVTISEADYSGPFTSSVASGAASVSVTPASGSGLFTITATATPGVASVMFADNHGGSITVTVTVLGPLSINQTALALSASGSPGNVLVSEANYLGTFATSVSGSASSITLAPTVANGPSQMFGITPTAVPGVATVTFTDNHGGTVSVVVTVYGPLSANHAALTLYASGASGSLTVSEADYSGAITASVTGSAASVSVNPAAGNGPSQTFTIVPTATSGIASITFSDNHGGTANVSVTVIGSITIDNPTLTLTAGGAPATVTVSEGLYNGPITPQITGSTNSIAINPAGGVGPSQTFTITPTTTTGVATVMFTDNHGGTVSSSVTVNVGPLTVTPPALNFSTTASQTLTATQLGYTGQFTATSTNTAVATVNPSSGSGQFTVSPYGNSGTSGSITVTGSGPPVTVPVAIAFAGPLTVSPYRVALTGVNTLITVTDTSGAASVSVTPADPTIVSVDSTSVALVSGTGTFNVQSGAATGTTTIVVSDGTNAVTIYVGNGVTPDSKRRKISAGAGGERRSIPVVANAPDPYPGAAGGGLNPLSASLSAVSLHGIPVTIQIRDAMRPAPAAVSIFVSGQTDAVAVDSIVHLDSRGNASLTIAPGVHQGSATLTLSDGRNNIGVSVVSGASLSPSDGTPLRPNFTLAERAAVLSLDTPRTLSIPIVESGGRSVLTASSTAPAVVAARLLEGPDRQQLLQLTAVGAGTAMVVVRDSAGNTQSLSVTVVPAKTAHH